MCFSMLVNKISLLQSTTKDYYFFKCALNKTFSFEVTKRIYVLRNSEL